MNKTEQVVVPVQVDTKQGVRLDELGVTQNSLPTTAITLSTARIVSCDEAGAALEMGGCRVVAVVDPSVHPTVLAGAQERSERILVERRADGTITVIGALRTQPTPGVDRAERYDIEADRIALRGEEISLSSRAAAVVLRAIGEVETYADRIISRAEGVHKIVGRMLRLN